MPRRRSSPPKRRSRPRRSRPRRSRPRTPVQRRRYRANEDGPQDPTVENMGCSVENCRVINDTEHNTIKYIHSHDGLYSVLTIHKGQLLERETSTPYTDEFRKITRYYRRLKDDHTDEHENVSLLMMSPDDLMTNRNLRSGKIETWDTMQEFINKNTSNDYNPHSAVEKPLDYFVHKKYSKNDEFMLFFTTGTRDGTPDSVFVLMPKPKKSLWPSFGWVSR